MLAGVMHTGVIVRWRRKPIAFSPLPLLRNFTGTQHSGFVNALMRLSLYRRTETGVPSLVAA